MANVNDVKNKEVKLMLNGVEHSIKFDLNAMAELEDRYGSVDAAFKKLETNSIKAIRCFLWAGLLHENPDLTEQQVGSWIDARYLAELTNSLGDAFQADMPVDQEPLKVIDGSNPNQ